MIFSIINDMITLKMFERNTKLIIKEETRSSGARCAVHDHMWRLHRLIRGFFVRCGTLAGTPPQVTAWVSHLTQTYTDNSVERGLDLRIELGVYREKRSPPTKCTAQFL